MLKWYKSPNIVKKIISHLTHKCFIYLQKAIHYHKKFDKEIKKGANWFSITDSFAKYVLDHKQEVFQMFHQGFCVDELFIQTLLWNSPYKNRLYDPSDEFHGCMRKIDWNRGKPYVWRNTDFEELIHSDRIFARKFSSKIDKEIIDNISQYIINKQQMAASLKR